MQLLLMVSPRRMFCWMWGFLRARFLALCFFSLYVADVVSLVLGCGIGVHMCADDLQIYFSDCLVNVSSLTDRLMDCIVAVGGWLSVNQLKFNPRKTEFLWLGTGPLLKKMDAPTLLVDGVEVSPALTVRDLGVVLDGCLTMVPHINALCRCCFYQLRRLWSIRKSVPSDVMKTLVSAFVLSRLDYCNGLLYGVAEVALKKVQLFQNAAARLVTGVGSLTISHQYSGSFIGSL